VISSVTGLFCHRRLQKSASLTPASGRQDHTTSPYTSCAVRQQHVRVHRIPPHVDDVRNAPLSGRDGGAYRVDLGLARSEIFLQLGLDSHPGDLSVGQSGRLCLSLPMWGRAQRGGWRDRFSKLTVRALSDVTRTRHLAPRSLHRELSL
jgi:hypothetical protein